MGIGDITAVGSTLSAPSNADLSLTTAGTGNVVLNDVSIKDNKVEANRSNDDLVLKGSGSGKVNINEAYTLPNADGSANQFLKTDGAGTLSFGTMSVGDLSIIGSSILSPSNADLTLNSSNGNVVIEGLRVSGTTLQTEDSSAGIQINGNLIPSQDGVFQLGSCSRRWQTLFVAAETIDLGGAVISSDTTGSLTISASGATLPQGSKVVDQAIVLGGKTSKTTARPVQIVKVYVSDGSSNFTDAQLLARDADLELEFNGTVEDVPVYTEANQSFTLTDGTSLASNAAGATLFQF